MMVVAQLGQRHAAPDGPSSHKSIVAQLTRRFLEISADFCELDLFNDGQLRHSSERPATKLPRGDTRRRRPRWVLLVRGLYCYTTARCLIYICLQYMYDFDSYAYEHLLRGNSLQPGATNNGSSIGSGSFRGNEDTTTSGIGTITASRTNTSDSSGTHSLQLLLEQKIERDIWRLKLVGAPFIRLHFGVEVTYIFLTWSVAAVYLRAQLYFRYVRQFDVSLLRAVVDWKREQACCDKMVRHEVNKFNISNMTFVQAHLHQRSCAGRPSSANFNSNKLLADLGRSSAHLNRMAKDGSLRPLNRSAVWIENTSRWMGYFSVCHFVNELILNGLIFVFFPLCPWFEMGGIDTSPMDLLSLVEALILAAIGAISLNVYISVATFNTFDQICTVNELNRLIECCIRCNTHTFRKMVQGRAKSQHQRGDADEENATRDEIRRRRQCYAQMNNNLLFVLMSYKIFVRQTKSVRSFSAFTMLMFAELMIAVPVISLINAQYLTPKMFHIVIGCCMGFIVLCDVFMAPHCYLHSRYLRTYRALHSLLAHTVALRCAAASPVDIYDSHTLHILRKELKQPDLLLKQFTIELLGVQITYTNFLKIHFLCGILVMFGQFATGPNKGSALAQTIDFF